MEPGQLTVAAGSLLLAGLLALLGLYLTRRSRASTNVTERDEKRQSEQQQQKQQKQKQQREVSGAVSGAGVASNKRQAKSKKRREAQQEFTHPWMVGALKGHSAPVLDMDFSANGKFLASCAEDSTKEASSPAAVEAVSMSKPKTRNSQSPPSPAGSTKSNTSSSSLSSSSRKEETQRAILSRRQRKNRTRVPRRELREQDDDGGERIGPPPSSPSTSPAPSTSQSPKQQSPKLTSRPQQSDLQNLVTSRPARMFTSVPTMQEYYPALQAPLVRPASLRRLSNATIALMLRNYLLTAEEMSELGYPLELSQFPGYVAIFLHHPHSQRHHRHSAQRLLDANAREFVPARPVLEGPDTDSGRGSTSSSLEGSDQEQEGSANDWENKKAIASGPRTPLRDQKHAVERRCVRCSRPFLVRREDGEYLDKESCVYHYGKLRSGQGSAIWECCAERELARGCTHAYTHVWTGVVPGYNGPFQEYVRTKPARHIPLDGNYGVYALDCEMFFTKRGLELGKITVVDLDGNIVYEALVRSDAPVIDYNTRFSGLRARDLARAKKSLHDVQDDLRQFIFAETILIGHGLENDLRALRLLHPTVIDTTIWYPHYRGLPYRNSLKSLASTFLKKDIQGQEHDSAEDARIALDLMYSKLENNYIV